MIGILCDDREKCEHEQMAETLLNLSESFLREEDVKICVELSGGGGVTSGLLLDAVGVVEEAAFELELEVLEELIHQHKPLIPEGYGDKFRDQIWAYRGKSFKVEHVENGSVEIWGSLALLAIWLLQTTLGETVKEAWLGTSLHRAIKKLLGGKQTKARRIQVKVEQKFQSVALRSRYQTTVVVERKDDSEVVRVVMEERAGAGSPPTPGSLLERSGRQAPKSKRKFVSFEEPEKKFEVPPGEANRGKQRRIRDNRSGEGGEGLEESAGGKSIIG